MAGVSLKPTGFGAFDKAMAGVLQKMAARQELAEIIGEQLVSSTLERFEKEKGPDGQRWEPSARAEAEGGQTMTDSGGLKGSVSYEASPAMVTVGSNKKYAAQRQWGGPIVPKSAKRLVFDVGGKKVFPIKVVQKARPYIGIDEEDIDEARETIAAYLAGGFGISK